MGTAVTSLLNSGASNEHLLDSYKRRQYISPVYKPILETDLVMELSSHYSERISTHRIKTSNVQKHEKFIKESESIEQWWKGEVTEIQKEKGYFAACLIDRNGNSCIAEFDIDKVFDEQSDIDLNLYPHAKFAFYVVNKHGMGRPRTESGLEFSAPYIWRENDNEVVLQLLNHYFPEDK